MSIETTIQFYLDNAEKFVRETINVDMSSCYEKFEKYIKTQGTIMDLGCGSGRDSLYFLKKGYDIVSIDAAQSMCNATQNLTKKPVRCIRFDELDYCDVFDGVWANASLLHVPKKNMKDILKLVVRAMKGGGVLYLSYKYGKQERLKDGRIYSDYTEDTIRSLILSVGELRIIELWTSSDVRSTRDDKWLNLVCIKLENEKISDDCKAKSVLENGSRL